MEIVYNNNVNKVTFDTLREGAVFKYNGILFMKIQPCNEIYNAVRLDNGGYTDFVDEYVEPIKGKFIID